MTSIKDIPNDPKYTIKNVCAQTGIQAVTLRAWERRHEVVNPHRSENRYRLYSERDIAILRWIKSRIDEGISISSAISELRTMNRNGIWPEAIPTMPAPAPAASAVPPDQVARQLFQALKRHDEAKAGDLLREAHTMYDLTTIFLDVITPALADIGDAWYHGEIRVTTEHFASAFIRGRLLTILQAYPTRRNAPYLMVGAGPTEQHEIGSLMMAILLRSNGFRVEYLGPDIPLEDLADYASYEHPDMIILTASLEPAAMELVHFQNQLRDIQPRPVFAYGGRIFDLKVGLRNKIPGLYLGGNMPEAIELIRTTLQKGKVNKAPAQDSL